MPIVGLVCAFWLYCAGTGVMKEVYIKDRVDPYVLEVDGILDLAPLQLQPPSIVINRSVATFAPNCRQ